MAPKDNFYQKLTRLFRSGPSIQRKIKGYDAKAVYDKSMLHNNLGYRGPGNFGKESSPFSALGGYGILDRINRYAEASEMESMAEIGTALDIYADETCSSDEKGKSFHIYSDNAEIKKALGELFYDVMNIEFSLRPGVRNLVKYGDYFMFSEVLPDVGIISVTPLPVNEIEREEGFDPSDPHAVRFKWLTRGNKILENWQISHFRILGNDLFLPYGTSILEPARRIFRQVIMAEDAMLTYRVVRSPERRVFYVDVGNTAPNDIPAYMEAAKSALRSKSQVDRINGRQDLRYNPVSIDEDYFIAIRGEAGGTKIETLAGGQHVSATEDVEYLQKKLFAALKIPRAYLGYEESVGSKATLAQLDVRFSRSINILQKIVISELNKLAMIHLYAKGFDGEDLINFELFLSNPSSVAVQQKLALWNDRIDIASKFKESGVVAEQWIQQEILGFTPEEITKHLTLRKEDVLYQKELEEIAVSSENQERQAVVDPFDPSNYQVPGADVEKSPNDSQTGGDLTDSELVKGIAKFDQDGELLRVETPPGKSPIQATPFATRRRRNEKRRVGQGGIDNLGMPSFKNMLDYSGRHQYNTDHYDLDFFKRKNESLDMVKDLASPPELTREMKSIFARLDEKFGRTKNKILIENLEERLEKAFQKSTSGILSESAVLDEDEDFEKRLLVETLTVEDIEDEEISILDEALEKEMEDVKREESEASSLFEEKLDLEIASDAIFKGVLTEQKKDRE
jgi:hypothetical protein